MSARRALARGGMIVSAAYLASHVLGYVRVFVITAAAPNSAATDTFFAAFSVPDLVFQLVAAGALSSALIPTIATLIAGDQQQRAWRVVSAVANLMLLALAMFGALVLVFAPAIVPLFMPGFTGDKLEQGITLTRIMMLSPILLALGSVATSVLNARGRFTASVLAPITYNIAIIAGALLLERPFGLNGLAVSVVIGAACHVGIQVVPLFRDVGFRYTPTLAREDPETMRTLLLLVPRAIGLGGAQMQLAAARAIGTTLSGSAVTAFMLGFTVFQIPVGVVGVPLGIVALPTLSQQVASGRTDEFVDLVARSMRLMLFLMVPIAFAGIAAAGPVMTVLFSLGRTDAATLDLAARTLALFLVALPSEALIVVLARAFYAMRDTKTPVAAALLAAVASVAVSVVVAPALNAPGLALGIAVASWFETITLLILLERRVPALRVGAVLRAAALFIAIGAAAGLAVFGVVSFGRVIVTPGTGRLVSVIINAIELAAGGLVGGLVYLGVAQLLHIPEGPTIVRLMTAALHRGSHS